MGQRVGSRDTGQEWRVERLDNIIISETKIAENFSEPIERPRLSEIQYIPRKIN